MVCLRAGVLPSLPACTGQLLTATLASDFTIVQDSEGCQCTQGLRSSLRIPTRRHRFSAVHPAVCGFL